MKTFDVAVIGLGAMGSSASYQLAKRKLSVLGLEQFTLAHGLGSSHGESRLIRKAYFEHPDYVPLLERSYENWKILEQETKTKLLIEQGLVIFGAPDSKVLDGVKKSAEKYHIPLERFTGKSWSTKYPGMSLPDHYEGLLEKGAGYLLVEEAIRAHCRAAQALGANLIFEDPVTRWSITPTGLEIVTEKETYTANRLIITAGAWAKKLIGPVGEKLQVRRVPQFWFDTPEYLKPEKNHPCFAVDSETGFFYGFPDLGQGKIKLAHHTPREIVEDPKLVDRAVGPEDLKPIEAFIKSYLPSVKPVPREASVCLYTMTPDEHFIVDTHPDNPHVAFAAGFSGHGFKFSSMIGEVLADLVTQHSTRHPVDFLKAKRF